MTHCIQRYSANSSTRSHADMSFAIQQWTTDIERNILDPASHDLIVRYRLHEKISALTCIYLQWYNENLRKILGLIDVSSQVCPSLLIMAVCHNLYV